MKNDKAFGQALIELTPDVIEEALESYGVRGYCNYYHVPGNTRRLDAFPGRLSVRGGMLSNDEVSGTV